MLIKFLDSLVYWSLIAIPFSISIAPAFTSFSISILFAAYFTGKIVSKDRAFARTVIDLPYLALVIISLISIVNSVNYLSSVKGVFKLVINGFLFLIFVDKLRDKTHVKRILLALALGACLASFDAVWQEVFGRDFIRGHELILNIGLRRATAAFPNANILGIYLSPIFVIVFALARYALSGTKKIAMYFAVVLTLVGIIFTFSRFAAVAAFAAVFIFCLIKKDRLMLTILMLLLASAVLFSPKAIKEWAKKVNYNPLVLMFNADRVSMYKSTLNMIEHHPFIGVGLNTFSLNYSKYKLPEEGDSVTGNSVYAHNNFLHMAGEIGLLGLLAFLWLLFRLFKKCADKYRSTDDKFIKVVLLSLTVSLGAFLINGLTETNLYYSRVAILFWYLAGLALSISTPRFNHKE